MNNLVEEVIKTLLSQRNIFKLIKLSKEYPEINLEKYYNYIPSINITYDWLEHEKTSKGYESFYIDNLKKFKIGSKIFTDKTFFLQNIEQVTEVTFGKKTFVVENGEYNASYSENFFSIEFNLNNLKGPAIIGYGQEIYCIDGSLLSKELHKSIIRKVKMNKLTNQPYQSPKELVKIEIEKSRANFLEKKRLEKEKIERKKAQKKYTYVEYDVDINMHIYKYC